MRFRLLTLAALGAAAATAGLAACEPSAPTISPTAPRETFSAQLSGAAEVPPVTTTASGSATVTFLDSNTIRYEVLVNGLTGVTQAHIHAGSATENGPVMVFLFPLQTTPTGQLTGVLRQADITRGTAFSGAFTFDSLARRIRAGTAYVNVHTSARPAGELRGQLAPGAPR